MNTINTSLAVRFPFVLEAFVSRLDGALLTAQNVEHSEVQLLSGGHAVIHWPLMT
ncbi:hypothetical protein J3D47_003271 [Pseudomonas laurylsulfativorans]|uniref:hypothetical protein n=1 Tax=Pseudomonas laurylsulfativorans TaxID=1943631 RepID=UPI00209F8180|nr:hypothetical protein [Pseudomonas laurylsulfativorans]MCP1419028.1 hypothetical protein [Pseudomonas laurylsulfativorans]